MTARYSDLGASPRGLRRCLRITQRFLELRQADGTLAEAFHCAV